MAENDDRSLSGEQQAASRRDAGQAGQGGQSNPFSGLYGQDTGVNEDAASEQVGASATKDGVEVGGGQPSAEPGSNGGPQSGETPQSRENQTPEHVKDGESTAPHNGFGSNPYAGVENGQQHTQPMQPQYGQYAQPQYGQFAPRSAGAEDVDAGSMTGAESDSQPTEQFDGQPTRQYAQGFGVGGPVPPVPGQAGNVPPYGADFGGPMNPNNPMKPMKRKKSNDNVLVAVVSAVLTAILCLGFGYVALSNGWVPIHDSSSMSGIMSNTSGEGTAKPQGGAAPDWTSVSKNVSNSVISIQTKVQGGEAKGSGAIIDTDGHAVTNNHVISGSEDIQVTLANGQMYKAKVTGTDPTTDLAVIQLQDAPKDLTPVKFANSDKLAVGENVMAVGNPLGYDDTATTGIVSAINRPVSVMDGNQSQIVTNAVQIDAAINPGNSGGPTFNAAGEVVGINSSIATASSSSGQAGSIGIGFAIPSNLVKSISDEIVKDGAAKHVILGVTIKTASTTADGITRTGAQITKGSDGTAVASGSPAAKAGLKEGDTIVSFNDRAVGSNSALLGYVRAASIGDKADLRIVRGGKTIEVNVTLDQEEKQVTGSNRKEKKSPSSGSNGQGDGQGDDGGNGDGGGIWDPFGFF